MDERDLPTGRLGRFARLASTGLRAGVGVLIDKDARAAAMHTAEVLGTLRGLAAKVGQMASYVDGVIPEGQREHYEVAMKGLRAATPRSSPSEVRALITAELGASPEELFAEWGEAPIASASIGQVHRARLHDGRAVAVKVQHPGVAAAVESDLSNGSILTSMASSMGMRRHDPDAVFAVIKARFREELDYAHEAGNQRHFGAMFEGDRHIRVPAVIDDRSTGRVLTMEFVEGRSFDEAVLAPREQREAWAKALWRYVFSAILGGGRFNADPHPGNYIFLPDGAVGVLDFGCVQRIPDDNRKHARAMHRAALARDEAAFRAALALMLDAKPGRIEEHGVLVDVDHLKAMSKQAGAEVVKLEAEAHAMAGHAFNVNSPKQLETILFDELKLPVVKKTKTGRSTDAEVLEELASQHPLPNKILEVRSLTKLIGTYLDALPQLVDSTGRVHTSFNQAVAATGRLSSNNPNLQNIPVRTPMGREIRRAFVAPEGCLILSADYSQIELRVLAHLSGDPILVDAFRSGDDVHVRTAMEIFKVSREDVSKEMRSKAKTTNFAVIYGQGESSLGKRLGITRDEAAEFIEKYFQTFATLRKYLDDVVEKARTGEGVHTILGRRRFLPDLHSPNRALRLTAERVAQNTPIQGTAADIIKLAMLRVDERLTAEKLATKMVSTVHDELVFEVPEGEKERVGPMVKETMEGVMKLDVPLVVECGWGKNWGDAH